MRSLRNAARVVACAIALGAVALPALGAPAPKTTTAPLLTSAAASSATTPVGPVKASAGGPVDVQIWPGQEGKTVVITVVEVDADTKLPTTVRIPVVPGTTVQWAGEIIGGDATADIEQRFKIVQGEGGEFAEFPLTKSRRGQIDAIGFPLVVAGDMRSVSLDWVQSVSSVLTAISVRLPANISKVEISPKPVGPAVNNPVGESLYSLNPKGYKPGEKQSIAISYSTIPEVVPTPGSDLTPILIGLGVTLLVAVGGLIYVIRRQSVGAENGAADVDVFDGDADEAVRGESPLPAEADDDPFDDLDTP